MSKQTITLTKHIAIEGIMTGYTATSGNKVFSPSGKELKLSSDGYYNMVIDGKRRRIKGTSIDFPEVKESVVKPKPKKKATPKKVIPKAGVHMTTKNISFLRVHDALKKAGVKNNKFMLSLFNPELEGINPRSAALTREVRDAIIMEIAMNPWYYLREVVKIELNQEIAASIYTVLMNTDVYVVTHELTAKPLYQAFGHLNAWIMATTFNSEAKVISRNDPSTRVFMDYVSGSGIKWIDKALFEPTYLSLSRIALEKTKSSMVVSPTPVNPTSASNVARGCTSNIIVMLDFEYIPSSIYMLQEMLPAFKTAKQRIGAKYSARIVLTTPSKDETFIKTLTKNVAPNSIGWDNTLYDITSVELQEAVKDSKFVYFELSPHESARFTTSKSGEVAAAYTIRPRSESKLTWYNEPRIVQAACNLYDTNEFGKYLNGVPERVLEDIVSDGHIIPVQAYNAQEVQNLVCDYTIRRICEVLVENYPIVSTDVGSTSEETLFNTFGTNSLVATNKLLTANVLSMGRYHNLLVEFMKVCTDITLVNSVGAGGLYNSEHVHTMMKTIYSK